jgi:hypothetical protein
MNFPLEAVRGLKASWRLLCMDEGGLKDFDLSAQGFWNSFAAFFLVAPLYLYSSAIGARLAQPPQDERSWFAALALLSLLWVLWPWIMVTISHMVGREKNYVRYIVAYNWSSVLVMAALVPVLMLQQFGILDVAIGALASLFVVLWSLFYRWYVAHKALDVPGITAAMLVAGDLAMTIVVSSLI